MVRFGIGIVLSIVLAAIGLLVAGSVAGSLLLVVVSIGVAALGGLLLLAAVLMWRREIFAAPQALGTAQEQWASQVPAAVHAAGLAEMAMPSGRSAWLGSDSAAADSRGTQRRAAEAALADKKAALADKKAAAAGKKAADKEAAHATEVAARAGKDAARAGKDAARAGKDAARAGKDAARADKDASRAGACPPGLLRSLTLLAG